MSMLMFFKANLKASWGMESKFTRSIVTIGYDDLVIEFKTIIANVTGVFSNFK